MVEIPVDVSLVHLYLEENRPFNGPHGNPFAFGGIFLGSSGFIIFLGISFSNGIGESIFSGICASESAILELSSIKAGSGLDFSNCRLGLAAGIEDSPRNKIRWGCILRVPPCGGSEATIG